MAETNSLDDLFDFIEKDSNVVVNFGESNLALIPAPQQLYERGICPHCLHDMWYEDYCQECRTLYIYRDDALVYESDWEGWGKDKAGVWL